MKTTDLFNRILMAKKLSFLILIIGIFIFTGCQNASNIPTKPDTDSILQSTQEMTSEISLTSSDSEIEWITPKQIESLKLFHQSSNPPDILYEEGQTKYYQIGTIRKGKYANDDILMAIADRDAPYYFTPVFRFIRDKNKLIFLKKYSDEIAPQEFINKNISFENSDELNALLESRLGAPEEISIPSGVLKNTSNLYHLKLTQKTSVFFSPKNLQPIFTLEDGRKIFMEKKGENTWKEEDNRLFQLHGFYLLLADQTVALYELEIPFITDYTPQIIWKNGGINSDRGGFWEGEGCRPTNGRFPKVIHGQIEFYSRIPEDNSKVQWSFAKDDLAVVGKTNTNESIYALKDDKNSFYKEYYEKIYIPTFTHVNDGAVVPYEEFTGAKPFLFWNDPFGRMNLLLIGDFYMGYECAGKPVIYLYPQSTQGIFVKVNSSRKQFVSIPKGDEGWNVVADPESHIVDLTSGKTYPYLFWEDAITYSRPKNGFVIPTTEVDAFLDQKLGIMGLNKQEITDFKAFWAPRMKQFPYAFVSFLQTDELNTIVPLEISPLPDSLIRVFMHFEGLEKPITIKPQTLKSGKRTGFTVVEWGGKL